MKTYHGECLCGQVQFSSTGDPGFPHLCHCHMCQRASGAPVVNWVTFPISTFKFEGAEPAYFQSSKNTKRGFCPKCGTSICAIDEGSDEIYITVTILDDKEDECFYPESESFPESSPSWMKP